MAVRTISAGRGKRARLPAMGMGMIMGMGMVMSMGTFMVMGMVMSMARREVGR